MKITKILAAGAIAALMASGAFAAKSPKTKTAAAKTYTYYVDWQGASAGEEIPEWVRQVVSSGSERKIRKLLELPDDYKIWTLQSIGTDLDALKLLTDNFDIQAEVSRSISQNIAQAARRHQVTEGKTSDATVTEQNAAVETLANTNVTLRGLELIDRYWTKYYRASDKKGKKPLAGESKSGKYMYLVVMGMSGENFQRQLNESMKKASENTSEDEFLRKLSSKVVEELVLGADRPALTSSMTGDLVMDDEDD